MNCAECARKIYDVERSEKESILGTEYFRYYHPLCHAIWKERILQMIANHARRVH